MGNHVQPKVFYLDRESSDQTAHAQADLSSVGTQVNLFALIFSSSVDVYRVWSKRMTKPTK